ncbi:KAR-UP F-box 1 [Tasmannia lanceolata]|uniref:KAR-UP F-box 1 n=1 Tax=Tasmannia lanceolata TaxID=3420 RepID=UPI004062F980
MAIAAGCCNNKRIKAGDPTKQQYQEEEEEEEEAPLIPGLHDHLSHICLSLLPPRLLSSVCRSWRLLLYSPYFPPFLSLYALLSSSSHTQTITFSSFDPISATWLSLPPPNPPPSFLLSHPSFIARHLSVQSVSLSGQLILLAATDHDFLPALSRPLIFNPLSNRWRLGPTIPTPRRWCASGSASGSVYVASGVGSDYSSAVARSAERWDLKKPAWEKVAQLKDGKFSREAVEAVGVKGKLCMVNVKGNAAKEGAVYDIETDLWEDMPAGMLAGWKGPAAAMEEKVIYVVEEGEGVLREYNWEMDCWKDVLESEYLKGAVQIAAGGGRVCVVRAGGGGIVVVDVVVRPARVWAVEPPPTTKVLAVHVLPRMGRAEF